MKLDFQPDERVGEFCHSPQQQRFFVKTGTHLFSLDAASGQVRGQLDFEGTDYSRVFWTDRDGQPALIEAGQVTVLGVRAKDFRTRPELRVNSTSVVPGLEQLDDSLIIGSIEVAVQD
ncbi:MAG: hypothetical protein AB7S38_11680 [Vulcanimicrobiota bacterium]